MKAPLPPFRFFVAWLSFGFCVTSGVTCLFYLFGIGKTSDLSSTALQHLDYSPPNRIQEAKKSATDSVTFDLPEDCPTFLDVVASIAQVRNREAAIRVSLYSSGVHWATAWSQATFGFPVYVLCLTSGFIALVTSLINCFWPPGEELANQPGKFKVRKIRMRVPQKHQKWSGYIYTHLYDDPPLLNAKGTTDGCSDQIPAAFRHQDDDTLIDREALKFLQRTISTCGSREQVDCSQKPPREDPCNS